MIQGHRYQHLEFYYLNSCLSCLEAVLSSPVLSHPGADSKAVRGGEEG